MSKLDQVVFLIHGNEIIESSIRDLDGRRMADGSCISFIDETTTPLGIAPRYHLRGNELWSWGHRGNFPRRIYEYETEAEAQEALEDTFADDFWSASDILAFPDREGAEDCLREIKKGAE